MESTKFSFDELLCHALLLFRQSRFYDNDQESEQKAYQMLGETKMMIKQSFNGVAMAKWGCTLECLIQKFYINGDTEEVSEEIDVALMNYWKKVASSDMDAFSAYLWLGYYFLLRFRSKKPYSQVRSKRVMSDILSFLKISFGKYRNKSVSVNFLPLFSAEILEETVCWVELVHNSCLCEKQSAELLHQLYSLDKSLLPQAKTEQDCLLRHIQEFYCF